MIYSNERSAGLLVLCWTVYLPLGSISLNKEMSFCEVEDLHSGYHNFSMCNLHLQIVKNNWRGI